MTEAIFSKIRDEAHAMHDEIVAWRRSLHANPELSFKEFRTTEFIVEKLKSFGYVNPQVGFGPIETGVCVCVGEGDRTVGLRCDIDALPIHEQLDVDWKSTNDGVMHACGHDAHAACMLATAKILKKNEAQLKGRVKIFFQPAEETRIKIYEKPLSGAGYVVRSGAIDDVDAMFGMHVWGVFEEGKVFVRSGPTMMASGRFNLKVIGKGTHGASPHLGHDPVTTTCQVVEALQTVVSREISPIEPALITIGTIHGGTATNIIPQEVEISGTIRAAKEEVVRFMGARIGEVAELTAQAHRCTTDYNLLINGPAVVNDSKMVAVVQRSATAMLGEERVSDVDMLTGSEDFREYSAKVPAALYFMGMKNDACGCGQPQHDPCFAVNDGVLSDAAAVMAGIAFAYFEQEA